MKKIKVQLFLFFNVLIITYINSQEIRHITTPNIIIGNTIKNTLTLDSSINFKLEPYISANYLITNKIALFGSYNFINWRNRRYTFLKGLFGGPGFDYVENNNSGFRFGIGLINLFKISKQTNTELLFGINNQKINILEYSPRSRDKIDIITQKYQTTFLQFNIIRAPKSKRYNLAYNIKLSYFKLNYLANYLYPSKNISAIKLEKDNLFLISQSANLQYQLKANKPFFISIQIGFSGALEEFNEHINREGFWGLIGKAGLVYKFNL